MKKKKWFWIIYYAFLSGAFVLIFYFSFALTAILVAASGTTTKDSYTGEILDISTIDIVIMLGFVIVLPPISALIFSLCVIKKCLRNKTVKKILTLFFLAVLSPTPLSAIVLGMYLFFLSLIESHR